ncbi:protein cramped-like [Folsomia candida]|nr:protein cramped-like [Folsomia candida]XP_021954462.1 protein cramped-like [Folsomia candida]XP_035709163.1 protein cramped-like [Folsomia candida]
MGKRKRSGSFSKSDDPGGAKRSDAEDSQEELDGETAACSTKGATPGGVGTRCSARVQEKQEKLRRESSPSKQILPLEVNCSSSATGSNVASAVSKGSVKNPSPNNDNAPTSNEVGASSQMGPALEEKRKKRTWELWSIEDKQLFFEALNENGKDFDAIQNYLASKAKSRKSGACGQYAPKNKDQVRHFYYRTWNKISKYLRFPDGMKKANQELYGLINYGELRKKQRILNSKTATKLCELVENGITSIKFRGKTCRIKTPVCRALKRLNGLDDVEHTRVPHKVSVEFIPRDGKTWRSIQSVSQNPRIKIVASLQRTFSSIISYLENKWKRKDDRLKEQFSSVFGKAPTRLRIIPDRRDFNIPLYRVAENTNSATICLRSYKKNVLVCETQDENETSSKIKRKRKQSGGGVGASGGGGNNIPSCSTDTPVVSAKCLVPFEYPMDPEETSDAESQSALLFPLASEDLQSNFRDDQVYFLAEQSDENALSTKDEIFSRHFKNIEDYTNVFRDIGYPADENQNGEINHLQQTETDNDDVEHELDEAPEEKFPEVEAKPVKTEKFISHLWDEDQVRRGWTAEETGTMTVGEVYLMLGQTEKISFEYFWDGPDSLEDVRTHSLLEKLIMTATFLRKKKTPRSKATTILNASIKCGAQLKCSTCGVKIEVPANLSCSTKTCSASGTASSINAVPNTAQPPLLVPRLKSNAPLSTSTTNGKQLSLFPPPQAILSAEPNVALTIPSNMDKLSVSATSSSSCEFTGSKQELSDLDKSLCLSRFIIPKTEPGNLTDNQMRFKTSETLDEGISPVNGLPNQHQIYNNGQSCTTTLMPYATQNSSTANNDNCLIELCSLATNKCNNPNISQNITATLLPPSSCMVRNPSGTVSIVSQQELGKRKNSDFIPRGKTEQITFHRPTTHLRTLEPAKLPPDVEFPPPKPFLDLPKGNRRLGRRPNFKRVVIPRVLPLLPKTPATTSTMSVMTSLAENVSTTISSSFINVLPVRGLSIISCAEQQREIIHSTTEAKPTTTTIITVTPPDNNNPQGINSMKLGYPTDPSPSSSTKPTTPRKAEAAGYEIFMNVAGTLSCSSTDFEDLLKLKRNEGNNNLNAGDVDSISLSSFMEISLPESAKMTANEMNIDDLDNSNISLSMIRLEKDTPPKDLITPDSSPTKRVLIGGPCGSDLMPDFDKTWSMDGGDLSLSNFFHFDSQRSNASETPENEVNFQAILDDGSLDFSSKLLPDVRR